MCGDNNGFRLKYIIFEDIWYMKVSIILFNYFNNVIESNYNSKMNV